MSLAIAETARIVLDYPPDPALACGGVWVDADHRFVPVSPVGEYPDEANGSVLWEYATLGGDMRACLLHVPAGNASRTWEILPDAGNGKYYEAQRTVLGAGEFLHAHPLDDIGAEFAERHTPLPERPGEQFGVLPLGERFQVRGARDLGVAVLATFSGAPFKPDYERPVDHDWVAPAAITA